MIIIYTVCIVFKCVQIQMMKDVQKLCCYGALMVAMPTLAVTWELINNLPCLCCYSYLLYSYCFENLFQLEPVFVNVLEHYLL